MLRQVTKLILVIICLLFLVACEKEDKVNYQQGFPTETSLGLSKFLGDNVIGGSGIFLYEEEETFTYTNRNGKEDERKLTYFQYTLPQLDKYIEPMFSTENPDKELHTLFENKELNLLEDVNQSEDTRLPDITMEEGNILNIKTNDNEATFSVPENLGIDIEEELIINMEQANEEGFIIGLSNKETGDYYYVFVLQDLSEMAIVPYTELGDAIEKEELIPYYPILKKVNDTLSKLDRKIIDTEKHQVMEIEKEHLLSEDSNYIYLNGEDNPLEEGKQRIQKVEDYAKGTEQNDAEFELNYDEIEDELSLDSVGIGRSKIVYFNENFIVLRLKYKGAITGSAGSTNVIIDLQEDKENPTYYLVDLGMII
ncbi:hypothetical protein [Oceanobacillus timonensis]|uniref:hypothetical protein n=1 Tax=Oceanobacillus timonensis TaxID=1926285 RepID=UPI0009BBC788|nr:hypothetical protein [Oceanobacillus timonensis]